MAGKVVDPVICRGSEQRNPAWELLSFEDVTELRWTVTEHGMGPRMMQPPLHAACQQPRL